MPVVQCYCTLLIERLGPIFNLFILFNRISVLWGKEFSIVYKDIAPFPKWLLEEEDIPVAKDPEGFDRLAFLNDLNEKIVGIMTSE